MKENTSLSPCGDNATGSHSGNHRCRVMVAKHIYHHPLSQIETPRTRIHIRTLPYIHEYTGNTRITYRGKSVIAQGVSELTLRVKGLRIRATYGRHTHARESVRFWQVMVSLIGTFWCQPSFNR